MLLLNFPNWKNLVLSLNETNSSKKLLKNDYLVRKLIFLRKLKSLLPDEVNQLLTLIKLVLMGIIVDQVKPYLWMNGSERHQHKGTITGQNKTARIHLFRDVSTPSTAIQLYHLDMYHLVLSLIFSFFCYDSDNASRDQGIVFTVYPYW